MATSIRQAISTVRNDLNSINIDDWIPAAYIYEKLKNNAKLFIKRDQDDRRMNNYPDLWTVIDCLEMEEVDLVQCCGISIDNCKTVMKSIKKIPEVYAWRGGYLLTITSIDYGRDYTLIDPKQFKTLQNREFVDKNKRYYWLENGHIVAPIGMAKVLKIRAMFLEKSKAKNLNCNSESSIGCYKLLDEDFVVPGHIIGDVINATVLQISGRKNIIADTYPNNNSNEKTNPSL